MRDKMNIQAANNKETEDELLKYTTSLLRDKEHVIVYGYAALTGWQGPKRCIISMTDTRLIILWLRRKYSEVQDVQDIPLVDIISFSLKFSFIVELFPVLLYNQKPHARRLYIEQAGKKRFAFAFDNRDIAKKMLEELEKRLPSFKT